VEQGGWFWSAWSLVYVSGLKMNGGLVVVELLFVFDAGGFVFRLRMGVRGVGGGLVGGSCLWGE